jgi:hypothetical protein
MGRARGVDVIVVGGGPICPRLVIRRPLGDRNLHADVVFSLK